MNEVFLVNIVTDNLNNFTRTAFCLDVFASIEGANAYIDSIKDETAKGNTSVILPYHGTGVSTEPISDETYDTPQVFVCRKVVYKWTNPITSASMRTTIDIERRQVF